MSFAYSGVRQGHRVRRNGYSPPEHADGVVHVKRRMLSLIGKSNQSVERGGSFLRMKRRNLEGVKIMLWTIFVILLILWLLGFVSGIGGGTSLIHLLLVVAVIVLIYNLVTGRRTI